MSDDNSQNFRENYQKLQQIANSLTQNREIDIDQLIPMVDEATKAYQVCKERIDAVEKALNKRLENEDSSN
ncbi:exodeoxyribonuclease VII small subunit [Thiomicrorhabdus sp. 6S2-11]|uniref:Exodeoxyribonuclease VII small subunit n=1 Tax=Thiomicrorhabdus marina TaxID=2818442 RepID=A0ABS3Q2M2_9GAMM|nr:exodeoxyribonuclease VII small subunit [Thiomicrorhabdus marina]MBO1926578.1 exodeoxyribonuclease VII small subunit [Thiomicrorhabdus marina]